MFGRSDADLDYLAPQCNPGDQVLECFGPFQRIESRPATGESGSLADVHHARIRITIITLDRIEDQCLVAQEFLNSVLDQLFNVGGRYPPASTHVIDACTRDQVLADIVAIAPALLVGVRRRHSLARVIIEQSGK